MPWLNRDELAACSPRPPPQSSFAAHERVTTAAASDQVRQRLVADWGRAHNGAPAGEAGLMIAALRADVDDLNARARCLLYSAGRLTGAELVAAERGFAVGKRVLCSRNDLRLGVVNGDLVTVTAVNLEKRTLTIRLDRGDAEPLDLPARYLDAGHLTHGSTRLGLLPQPRTFVVPFRMTAFDEPRNAGVCAWAQPCELQVWHTGRPNTGEAS